MTLFTDSYLEMLEENDKASSNKREKRTVVNREIQKWPQCTIPFELDNEYYTCEYTMNYSLCISTSNSRD